MTFESAKKAAERLGCTERAVQKWAKEGKIPYAYKDGRDWKIPENATVPTHNTKARAVYNNEPYPIIHTYTSGKILDYLESIENEDDKAMAYCEYYYFTGQFKESTIAAEPYLDSHNPILKMTAAVFCLFANLSRGIMHKSGHAGGILKEEMVRCFGENEADFVKAVAVFSTSIVNMQLHLPHENIPLMRDYMKYLDGGIRSFACYLMAYKAYLDKDYSRSLGIVETALSMSVVQYPIPMIYLYIISAMDYMNLMQPEKAKEYIEKAWELAAPDGLIIPFVEHYNLLQGLIEKHFKKNHPQDYNKIIAAAKQYNLSWHEVYNESNSQAVASNLTHIEFTVAMLYSRNWRVKEIAAHMELSERTITNYITVIYDKLGINGKKELEKYMLK